MLKGFGSEECTLGDCTSSFEASENLRETKLLGKPELMRVMTLPAKDTGAGTSEPLARLCSPQGQHCALPRTHFNELWPCSRRLAGKCIHEAVSTSLSLTVFSFLQSAVLSVCMAREVTRHPELGGWVLVWVV